MRSANLIGSYAIYNLISTEKCFSLNANQKPYTNGKKSMKATRLSLHECGNPYMFNVSIDQSQSQAYDSTIDKFHALTKIGSVYSLSRTGKISQLRSSFDGVAKR